MNRICPKCGTEIPEANVNAQTGIAQCPGCNEVFTLAELSPPPAPPTPVSPAPPPEAAVPQATARFCEKCGARLGEGAKFCAGCGTPVGAVAVETAQVVYTELLRTEARQPVILSAPLPSPAPVMYPSSPPPVPLVPPKKNRTPLYTMIAVAGLGIILFLIFGFPRRSATPVVSAPNTSQPST